MPDPLKVFYSWQSDRQANRNFLDDALDKALKRINHTDSTRTVELDLATRNVPGASSVHAASNTSRKFGDSKRTSKPAVEMERS